MEQTKAQMVQTIGTLTRRGVLGFCGAKHKKAVSNFHKCIWWHFFSGSSQHLVRPKAQGMHSPSVPQKCGFFLFNPHTSFFGFYGPRLTLAWVQFQLGRDPAGERRGGGSVSNFLLKPAGISHPDPQKPSSHSRRCAVKRLFGDFPLHDSTHTPHKCLTLDCGALRFGTCDF